MDITNESFYPKLIENLNILAPKSEDQIKRDLKNLSQGEKDKALLKANRKGFIKIAKLLIDAGANIHTKKDYALRIASEYGHTEVVKLLLDAGADVHANNNEALRSARKNGYTEIVKLLKQYMNK
jgi:ankyrin repeat protein